MIRGKEVCELWCTEPGVFVSEKSIFVGVTHNDHDFTARASLNPCHGLYTVHTLYVYKQKQLSYEYWVDDMPFSRGVPAPPLEFYYTLFIVLFSSHPPKTRKDQWIGWIGQIICSQEFSSKMTGEGMTGEGFHSFLWGKMFTHCWLPHYVVDGRYPAN